MTTITELSPAYERFLRFELQRADQTVTAYLSDLRGLSSAVNKPVEAITKADLRSYMQQRGERGISRATVRRSVQGMSTFWKWMMDEGYASANATAGIVVPKRERRFARWLTEAELRHFVDTPDTPRNTLAWGLLAWLGLRRNELLRMRVGDVSLTERLITVRNTKDKVDRTLPIPSALVGALKSACQGRAAACYVVPGREGGYWSPVSFYRWFRRHCEAAGVAGITPHTLRHTLATHMSARGVPLRIIQQWLGHARIETTAHYLQVAPEFMTDALEKHVLNGAAK